MLAKLIKPIALVAMILSPMVIAHLPSVEYPSANVARASIGLEWRSLGLVNVSPGGVLDLNQNLSNAFYIGT
jgi:hypothetical protein